jgi:hypothetical protein
MTVASNHFMLFRSTSQSPWLRMPRSLVFLEGGQNWVLYLSIICSNSKPQCQLSHYASHAQSKTSCQAGAQIQSRAGAEIWILEMQIPECDDIHGGFRVNMDNGQCGKTTHTNAFILEHQCCFWRGQFGTTTQKKSKFKTRTNTIVINCTRWAHVLRLAQIAEECRNPWKIELH